MQKHSTGELKPYLVGGLKDAIGAGYTFTPAYDLSMPYA